MLVVAILATQLQLSNVEYLSIVILVTIAAIGAFLIGHSEEGAAVLFFSYLAEYLDDYAIGG
ncbi:MAG: hypothetical protein DRZ82_06725 [Thermoprotei archaeon]|nr:MAG: hypothetical protein DRZ82_06725 [Thermoprotei archaeon]